jgi:D-arabinose 1-dehydrogenase-like Zn-dependent alcohol dehydrogenase
MTSATQIRTAWPTLNEKRKTALVMSLYPVAQKNPKLAQTVVKLLDAAIGTVAENQGWAATLETVSANGTIANTSGAGAGMSASYQRRDNQPIAEDYLDERRL